MARPARGGALSVKESKLSDSNDDAKSAMIDLFSILLNLVRYHEKQKGRGRNPREQRREERRGARKREKGREKGEGRREKGWERGSGGEREGRPENEGKHPQRPTNTRPATHDHTTTRTHEETKAGTATVPRTPTTSRARRAPHHPRAAVTKCTRKEKTPLQHTSTQTQGCDKYIRGGEPFERGSGVSPNHQTT